MPLRLGHVGARTACIIDERPRGVVDGHENVIPTIAFFKLYEVQKNLTLDGHNYGVDWFAINEKFFQGLPADLQKVVQDAGKNACIAERSANRKFTEDGLKILKEKGVSVYTPTVDEMAQFKTATQKPVIDWLKTTVDPTWVDAMLAGVKDVEAEK